MSHDGAPPEVYGQPVIWSPARPRFAPLRLVLAWLVAAVGVWVATTVLPGTSTPSARPMPWPEFVPGSRCQSIGERCER